MTAIVHFVLLYFVFIDIIDIYYIMAVAGAFY